MQPKKLPYAERMLKKQIGGRLDPIKRDLRRLYRAMMNGDRKSMSTWRWAALDTVRNLQVNFPRCTEVNSEIEYALSIAREAQISMNFSL